eukprot:scaffold88489_cov35-Tisochrysis_lutea.AAC.2
MRLRSQLVKDPLQPQSSCWSCDASAIPLLPLKDLAHGSGQQRAAAYLRVVRGRRTLVSAKSKKIAW